MSSPRVAVVIVAYRSRDDVLQALAHLERQTAPPARTIVVENDGGDDTAAAVRAAFPAVEVIEAGKNLGFAAGNNRAFALCGDCEWIALLNPDAFPERAWLAALHEAARRSPAYSFFGSRLLDAGDPTRLDGTGDAYHVSGFAWRRDHGRAVDEVDEGEREVFAPCAAAAMYRRDALEAVGGFDERYFCYFEDVDLAFRLRLAGHRCLSVPSSVVRHRGSASTGRESPFTLYYSHRNLVWTWVRDMPASLAVVYAPQFLASTIVAIGWYAMRGNAPTILRAKRDGFRELPRLLRSRHALQRARVASPRGLLRQMARGRSAYTTAAGRARGSLDAARDVGGSGRG
jgi:GT2 family glycosyltransferase